MNSDVIGVSITLETTWGNQGKRTHPLLHRCIFKRFLFSTWLPFPSRAGQAPLAIMDGERRESVSSGAEVERRLQLRAPSVTASSSDLVLAAEVGPRFISKRIRLAVSTAEGSTCGHLFKATCFRCSLPNGGFCEPMKLLEALVNSPSREANLLEPRFDLADR